MDLSINCSVLTREKLQQNLSACVEALREFPREYWQAEHFLHELPDKWQLSVMAQQNAALAGFIIASRKSRAAHIHKFIVLPRARGLGSALLNYFIERCQHLNLPEATLWVYADNPGAIRFYQRHGFTMISQRRDGDDELYFMAKNLLQQVSET